MLCCLNPDCPSPLNPDGNLFCQSCSVRLIELLGGHYRITNILSDEGGFGRTYLAEDIHKLNELCVVKQLAPKVQGTWALKKAMDLFQEEAKRLQQLGEHHQIPTLLAYFEQENNLYLVQQFIDGQNLLKELNTRGIYIEAEIKELLLDLLPVLKFVHEHQVIHRDIKPQNIIRRQSDRILVLIDFGASKQLTASVHTKMGTTIGSHGYSPVEQIKDGEAYPASDLFSLGATCFHLLTGISPFHLWVDQGFGWVTNWRKYLKNPISQELAEVLDKLLKKERQERYQSADEVIGDLTRKPPPPIPPTVPVSSSPPSPPPILPTVSVQPVKTPKVLLEVIVPGVVLLASGAMGYWLMNRILLSNLVGSNPTPLPMELPTATGTPKPRIVENLEVGWVIKTQTEIYKKNDSLPKGSILEVTKKPYSGDNGEMVVDLRLCSKNGKTISDTAQESKTLNIPLSELKNKVDILPDDQTNLCKTAASTSTASPKPTSTTDSNGTPTKSQ